MAKVKTLMHKTLMFLETKYFKNYLKKKADFFYLKLNTVQDHFSIDIVYLIRDQVLYVKNYYSCLRRRYKRHYLADVFENAKLDLSNKLLDWV
jgi:hypothetical protein